MLTDAWNLIKTNLRTKLHEALFPQGRRADPAPGALNLFKSLLAASHRHGRFFEDLLPDQIAFGPAFAERFGHLHSKSSDGRERARVVFYQPQKNIFAFGPTHIGDNGSVLHSTILPEKFAGRGFVPIISVHTHPPSGELVGIFHRIGPECWKREVNRPLEHFSKTDIESLVTGPVMGSIVITPGRLLMALRTERTKSVFGQGEISRRLEELMEQAKAGPCGDEAARVFTKLACIEFGLSLYISAQNDPGTFRKVRLTPRLAAAV